jgi:hypothetical protein
MMIIVTTDLVSGRSVAKEGHQGILFSQARGKDLIALLGLVGGGWPIHRSHRTVS